MNNGTGNVVKTSSTWEKTAGDDTTIYTDNLDSTWSYIFTHVNKLTPDPSPTQASDSEPMVFTLKINWGKKAKKSVVFFFKSVILEKMLFD